MPRMAKSAIPRLEEKSCALLVVDMQEKFVPVISNWEETVKANIRLIKFFRLIQAPVVATEQYPKGLGHTIAPILDALKGNPTPVLEKTTFSVCASDLCKKVLEMVKRPQWIVCGIETHVCIQQTVLDLLDLGHQVFLPADAVSSRHPYDEKNALERMARAGAVVSTAESLIFEIMRDAKHPHFKEAVALVK
jgi:nicotinamidase-related amidase